MNAAESKAKARTTAVQRVAPPRTSEASTTNTQSEVTQRPPAIYQVPKINVPESMEECAKLIQRELTSIQQSQSVLLTLWEKLQAQAVVGGNLVINRPLIMNQMAGYDSLYLMNPAADLATTSSLISSANASITRWRFGPYLGNWDVYYYDANGAYVNMGLSINPTDGIIRGWGGAPLAYAATVESQINMSIALEREAIKQEIYTELARAGVSLPDELFKR